METAADIINMLDAYAATTGGTVPQPGSAFVSGYDFLYDTALEVQAELEAGIGAAADTLAESIAPFGYLASDVMNAIPGEIKKLTEYG